MVERLMAINWADQKAAMSCLYSRAALMREYFRRSALWADRYQAVKEWPFFDIAAYVDPAVRVPEALMDRFEDFLNRHVGLPVAYDMCKAAVQWSALLERSEVPRPPLEDPFEPLILLFERGGGFATENRAVDFWVTMVRWGSLESRLQAEPPVVLDAAALDALDASGS